MDTESRAHTARQDHYHEGFTIYVNTASNAESTDRLASHLQAAALTAEDTGPSHENHTGLEAWPPQLEIDNQFGGTPSQRVVSRLRAEPASLLPLDDSSLSQRPPPFIRTLSAAPPGGYLEALERNSLAERIRARDRAAQELRQPGSHVH